MSTASQIPSINPLVRLDRKSTIVPARPSQPQRCKLGPSDLQMLCSRYIQKGLVYHTPFADDNQFVSAVELLKKSLSESLVYFCPLAGRLITSADGVVYIDCNDAGADLIEASAPNVAVQEVMEAEVRPVVRRFFALDGAINLNGHFLPLLVVQVTKLRDGMVIGFTINHAVVDGTSFWHFINSFAELCRGAPTVSHPPLHNRCFEIEGSRIALNLPETLAIDKFCPPVLGEKIFHFTKETIKSLKDRANGKNSESQIIISSFQALSAHVWQAITRARGLGPHETTILRTSVNCRPRLNPPLPHAYFGNAHQVVSTTVTAGELLACDISSAAGLLHRIIWPHRDADIRGRLQSFYADPVVFKMDGSVRDNCVMLGSSSSFPMYDNDFGWGRPVGARSGWANKFDGKVSAYPAKEAGGVDLEICLLPPFMAALDTDPQFLVPICN